MTITYSAWIRSGLLSIHLFTIEYPDTASLLGIRWSASIVKMSGQDGGDSEVLASIDSKEGYASHEEALVFGVNHFR